MMDGLLLAAMTAMNVLAFCLMGEDKRRARRGLWRIPEKNLFLAAACFGGIGGMLGMRVFRHKTRHWYFQIGFPALAAAQVALAVYLLAK